MNRSGFSLASLFVLIAVAAVFTATIQVAIRHGRVQSGLAIAVIAGLGPFVGLIVGGLVSASQRRSGWGTAMGWTTGLISGALAGVLMVVPESIATVAVGSAVIVLFSLVVRRLSRSASEP